jgi:pimeloyl-ACP methyl ester carboxylesterase
MSNKEINTLHYYDFGIDQLSYFDVGKSKTTLLLIHGFGEDHCIWKKQIEFLSPYFRIIAPNLPGIHCKALPIHHSEKPTINHYVEVLHELMHHLHIEKYYVLGHSMGGYIGLAFADYYINHVIGLGLIHSTSFEDSEAKKESRLKVAEFIEEYGTQKFLETSTPNLFGNKFKKEHPGVIQDVMDSINDTAPETMIQFVMAMRNRRAHTHLLQQQRIPLWMVVGDEDIAVPYQDSLQQTQLLPESNVIVLKGVGHMGMLEATDTLNNALLGFIQAAEKK